MSTLHVKTQMLMTVSGQRKVHLGPVETNNLSSLGGSFKFKKKFPLI